MVTITTMVIITILIFFLSLILPVEAIVEFLVCADAVVEQPTGFLACQALI